MKQPIEYADHKGEVEKIISKQVEIKEKVKVNRVSPVAYRLPGQDDLYKTAIEHFGINNQMLKLTEEMAELTHALMRRLQMTTTDELAHDEAHWHCESMIREEMVDVAIVLEQLAIVFFDDANRWCKLKKAKLERLKKRIEGGVYDKNMLRCVRKENRKRYLL